MTNPHNVDICVTCVSDKPPQLPLREELPSLGIEVVYNAHGLGAKASKQEQRKKLKQFRDRRRGRKNKQRQGDDAKESENERTPAQEEEREQVEEDMRVPHALSYNSYQERLLEVGSKSDKSSSSSSWPSGTSGSSDEENKVYDSKRQDPMSPTMSKGRPSGSKHKPPIKNLEIPTHSPEEMALQEAFNVFSSNTVDLSRDESRETQKTPSRSNRSSSKTEGREQASGTKDQSTLTTRSSEPNLSQSDHEGKGQVRVVAQGSSVEQDLPGLAAASSPSGDNLTSSGPTSTEGSTLPSLDQGPHDEIENVISKSVKVSHVGDSKSDFIDLTEFSGEEKANIVFDSQSESESSKDLSTLSSKKDHKVAIKDRAGVHVYPSEAIKQQLPGLRLQIPESDDGFGRIVLDLSDVREEGGPGSPLVYDNKVTDKVIHSPHKRQEQFFDRDFGVTTEGRQDDSFLASPTYPTQHLSGHNRDERDPYMSPESQPGTERPGWKSLFDESSSFGLSQNPSGRSSAKSDGRFTDADLIAPAIPEDDAVFHSPHKSYSADSDLRVEYEDEFDEGDTLVDSSYVETASGLERNSASERWGYHVPSTEYASPLSPSLKKAVSRDSEAKSARMSVSFSHDVEERYYFHNEQPASYDEALQMISRLQKPLHRTPEEEEYSSEQADDEDSPATSSSDESPSPSEEAEALPRDWSHEADEAFYDGLAGGWPHKQPPGYIGGSSDSIEEAQSPEIQLLDSLTHGSRLPPDVAGILERNPDLARAPLAESGLCPLHAACTLEFTNRFAVGQRCLVKDLVADVVERRMLIDALVKADPDSCRRLDENGDLPVHIMARQLMEWEARWYQKVYERAKEDGHEHAGSGAGITTLYQTMSRCINTLLVPVSASRVLCQEPGSIGTLLPLHIAAIFTVAYDTLKDLLEMYPPASKETCDLEEIRTFIPTDSIPLELHSRLSTDFPKWEIDHDPSVPEHEIQWTQSTIDKSYGTTGGMRRSDLMFSFHPNVVPYRHETTRIRRLESRIKTETVNAEVSSEISMAVRSLWEWMCTFEGDQEHDHYGESVQRILQALPLRVVKLLLSTKTEGGRHIADVANSACSEVMRSRLQEIAENDIPVPGTEPLSTSESTGCFLLNQWEETMANRFHLQSRGFVGALCRKLFNITEPAFPSSFVLLPYQLVKDKEGRLGLDSAEAASVAMKYADCLLHLTDPKSILHVLEKKTQRFLGVSLGMEKDDEWDQVEEHTKDQVNKLLALYRQRPGYFYFLDEYTGVPIVSGKGGVYPLVVSDASSTVRKILPLMLSGMILMRGEKALPVICKVLLDSSLTLVQEHWVEAAKDLLGFLYSPQTEWSNTFLQELRPLRARLVDFVEKGVSNDAPEVGKNGLSSEWVVETSLVKMIVEMHDANHEHSGLRPKRAGLNVLWTRDVSFLDGKVKLSRVDFKSLWELREQSEELEEETLEALHKIQEEHEVDFESDEIRATSTEDDAVAPGYEMLFRELSFAHIEGSDSQAEKKEDDESRESSSQDVESFEPFVPEPPQIVRKLKYATAAEPVSLLDFEDDMGLDDVLQLRILLDEQEAKLEFLREKIVDLSDGERELLVKEEQLGDMLDGINNQKDVLLTGPSNKGLSSARKLLLRICELEDRVLCREVEVGQLKNDISCFEMEVKNEALLDNYDLIL